MSKARDLADLSGLITSETGSIGLPSGTTAQRDGSPSAGYFRYNGTLSAFEGYNGTSWGSVGGGATGGGSSKDFVATGTIASAGLAVALNGDGTVSVVGQTGGGEAIGTATVFESAGSSGNISSAFDTLNDKVVIAYQDLGNSNYGTAIVGTVSGTSITFGTAVVFNTSTQGSITLVYDSLNNKVVIAYQNVGNSSFGTAIVGTVSGTSISFGTAAVFESASAPYISTAFDNTNNKVVIAYRDNGNTGKGTAIVGTVSGTSISFGTAVVFGASATYTSAVYDSTNNKVVITYQDLGNSSYGTAVVGTVSGTAISFGTPVVFSSAATSLTSAMHDLTNNKIAISYRDDDATVDYGKAIVGTVSGTTISFGTAVVFASVNISHLDAIYDTTAGKILITYRDEINGGFGTLVTGAISGNSISFGTATVFASASSSYYSISRDTTKNIIAYADVDNSSFGTAIVYQTDTSNNSNTIGIAQASATDAQTVSVGVKGFIDANQTDLTIGSDYYVTGTGTLTENSLAGVYVGKALSATELYIDRL